jgi:hypothetical protein
MGEQRRRRLANEIIAIYDDAEPEERENLLVLAWRYVLRKFSIADLSSSSSGSGNDMTYDAKSSRVRGSGGT